MYQGIQPEENRKFTSSIGNWTGNVIWDSGPIGGKAGLMKFTCPAGGGLVIATLSYPYVRALRGRENQATLGLYFPAGFELLDSPTITLTDGIYTYINHCLATIVYDVWLLGGFKQDLPQDWKEENTTLTFGAENVNEEERVFYADDASLFYIPRIDYLPVMGIG